MLLDDNIFYKGVLAVCKLYGTWICTTTLAIFLENVTCTLEQPYKIESLYAHCIANNQLDQLPRKIFQGFVNLRALNLSTNAINDVDFDRHHMNNINVLDLSHNFIRYFDEKFTSQIDLIPYSLAISLESNPLECSCCSLSFLKWFQQKNELTFCNVHKLSSI